jgi:hypothetical protein
LLASAISVFAVVESLISTGSVSRLSCRI